MNESCNSSYRASKVVGVMAAILGWSFLAFSAIALVYGALAVSFLTQQFHMERIIVFGLMGFSVFLGLAGLLLACVGELIRATSENARNTAAMLALMKTAKVDQ